MKIVDARVNWYVGFMNDPELSILVHGHPEHKDLRYEQRGPLYFAECDGYVSFFAHSGNPEQQEGYCGDHFRLTMKDGTDKVLKGPWSSRSGVMNAAGFTPSREVVLFTDDLSYLRNYTGFAAHITEELYLAAVKEFCPGAVAVHRERYGEKTLYLRLSDVENPCETCKGFKSYVWPYETGGNRPCPHCNGTGIQSPAKELDNYSTSPILMAANAEQLKVIRR